MLTCLSRSYLYARLKSHRIVIKRLPFMEIIKKKKQKTKHCFRSIEGQRPPFIRISKFICSEFSAFHQFSRLGYISIDTHRGVTVE